MVVQESSFAGVVKLETYICDEKENVEGRSTLVNCCTIGKFVDMDFSGACKTTCTKHG
jgi:hypothetical protein